MKMAMKKLDKYPSIIDIFDYYRTKDAVFLDSSQREHGGRYSIIGMDSYMEVLKELQGVKVNGERIKESLEEFLEQYMDSNKVEGNEMLPITSGAIGFFSYDYGREYLNIETVHKDKEELPQCILRFYDIFIIEDHFLNSLHLVVNGNKGEPEKRMDRIMEEIFSLFHYHKEEQWEQKRRSDVQIVEGVSKEGYLETIDKMQQYMEAGDIYVGNLTQTFGIQSKRTPYEIFRKLRSCNPSPFGAFLDYGDLQIISASPERFLKVRGQRVETVPIKGTVPRGVNQVEDQKRREELASSEKDKSELLMIVDLERNDLNRVCQAGTVKVTGMYNIEEFETVFHLTSTIEGRLREGVSVVELLHKTFPGGSITGAPKRRAMEIIDEVENGQRGIYTGILGYMSLCGNCDFNMIIRTIVCMNGEYTLGAGGGITWESHPKLEYDEMIHKANGIWKATL